MKLTSQTARIGLISFFSLFTLFSILAGAWISLDMLLKIYKKAVIGGAGKNSLESSLVLDSKASVQPKIHKKPSAKPSWIPKLGLGFEIMNNEINAARLLRSYAAGQKTFYAKYNRYARNPDELMSAFADFPAYEADISVVRFSWGKHIAVNGYVFSAAPEEGSFYLKASPDIFNITGKNTLRIDLNGRLQRTIEPRTSPDEGIN